MNEPAALRALDRARAMYESDGFVVTVEERLPSPFEGFLADAVARRDDEVVIIEVRSSDMSDQSRNRLARLAEVVRSEIGWSVDVVTYEPEAVALAPEADDVVRRIEEARRVRDISPDAAVLLTWSAIEGALLYLSRNRGQEAARPAPPRRLIHELEIDGVLSDNWASELDDFARLRNAVAHGLSSSPLDGDRFERLAEFAVAAAGGRIATVDSMVDWFLERYASPDEIALPHDSEEGVYFWFGAGPHAAEDVLRSEFHVALDADIDEATSIIERDGIEWAEKAALLPD